jgi:hypothetical protein
MDIGRDGRAATIRFRDRHAGWPIVAGFDGWSRSAVSAQKDMIDTELEECASDPLRAAYWILVRDGGAKPVRQERQLLPRRGGHQGVFIPER